MPYPVVTASLAPSTWRAPARCCNCSTASEIPFSPPAGPPGWPAESIPPQVLRGNRRSPMSRRAKRARSLPGIMPRSLSCASTIRIVVVDRGNIDILRAHAGGPPQLAGEGADAGLQAVALLIVVVEACAVRAHVHGRAAARTTIGAGDDDRLRARDHRHAVVARQRVGDQRR